MKRKDFIQKLTLVGVGFGLTPTSAFALHGSVRSYRLPRATIHIPHGNFATSQQEKLIIPECGIECQVQQFMRNGIEASKDDLTVYSFSCNGQFLNMGQTRDGVSFSNGHIDGLRLAFEPPKIKVNFNRHTFVLEQA